MADLALTEEMKELISLLEGTRFDLSNFFVSDVITDSGNASNNVGKCWIDGRPCPYGDPEGRFSETPVQFCQECHINYDSRLEELFVNSEFLDKHDKEVEQDVREEISFDSVDLLDLLKERAKNTGDNVLSGFVETIGNKLKLGEIMVVEVDKITKAT